MTKANAHCECPEKGEVAASRADQYLPEERAGMHHAPGECKGIYGLRLYKRGDKTLMLCSCCNLFGDILVEAN